MTINWQLFAHPGPANAHVARRANTLISERMCPGTFWVVNDSYDRWDYVHFRDRGIGRSRDVWDNRRKIAR